MIWVECVKGWYSLRVAVWVVCMGWWAIMVFVDGVGSDVGAVWMVWMVLVRRVGSVGVLVVLVVRVVWGMVVPGMWCRGWYGQCEWWVCTLCGFSLRTWKLLNGKRQINVTTRKTDQSFPNETWKIQIERKLGTNWESHHNSKKFKIFKHFFGICWRIRNKFFTIVTEFENAIRNRCKQFESRILIVSTHLSDRFPIGTASIFTSFALAQETHQRFFQRKIWKKNTKNRSRKNLQIWHKICDSRRCNT